jgi:hypothetical protein
VLQELLAVVGGDGDERVGVIMAVLAQPLDETGETAIRLGTSASAADEECELSGREALRAAPQSPEATRVFCDRSGAIGRVEGLEGGIRRLLPRSRNRGS